MKEFKMKTTILVTTFLLLIGQALAAGVGHGNSGDGKGLVAFQGKKGNLKGSEKKIVLQKLKNKIETEFQLGFSKEFEASRMKYFYATDLLGDISSSLSFKSKDNINKFYKALKSGQSVQDALNLYNMDSSKELWSKFSKRHLKNAYNMDDLDAAFSGSNFLVNLKLQVNPNLAENCPRCKPEDFHSIPQEGIELKIICSPGANEEFVEIDHDPIILFPNTKKIERKITISSSDLAEFYRLKSCDRLDRNLLSVEPECHLTYEEGNNVLEVTNRNLFLQAKHGNSMGSSSFQASFSRRYVPYYETILPMTPEEFLSQNPALIFKKDYNYSYSFPLGIPVEKKTLRKYYLSAKYDISRSVIKYHNEEEVEEFIKAIFLRAYKK